MDCVITLASGAPLDPRLVARCVVAVSAHRSDRHPSGAFDLYATGQPAALRAALLPVLADAPVDAIVQPLAMRTKRLLISDMDSTLIGQECIDELAASTGNKERVAAITARAMAGELDFAEALTERVTLLKGTPLSAIDALLAEVITLSPGAAALIARCRASGVRTVLVSGGFMQFAGPIAARLGMDVAFANTLEVDGDMLTGRVVPPILGADAKLARLTSECDALGVLPDAAVAVGDGANDLRMVEAAGLGLAYRAKPALQAAADALLDHAPLNALADAMGLAPEPAPVEPASVHDPRSDDADEDEENKAKDGADGDNTGAA